MAKWKDVGQSRRTPAKHELMRNIVGKEVGAAGSMQAIERLVWADLTAGSGVPVDGLEWERNCSPGILAYHATRSRKPVDITLYEIKPATFDLLLASLHQHLPALGYTPVDEGVWRYRETVLLLALNQSGEHAGLGNIKRGDSDAVVVTNDPNAITDWAMRPSFAQEIANLTPWFRSISTMGCNVGGLKRLDLAERAHWFDLVSQQEAALPPYRDLLLAAIEHDAAQWAYLLCEPVKWKSVMEKVTRDSFKKFGYALDLAWYRSDPARFAQLKQRLFLTSKERGSL